MQPAIGQRPLLVLMVGPPGSGKSYLARRLVSALDATLVQTDVIRKQRFRHPRYTPPEHAAVYRLAHQQLRRLLEQGRSAVFDATNLLEDKRRVVYGLAEEAGARLLIVWTYAPAAVVAERMVGREAGRDLTDASDATWDIYLRLRRRMDPIPRPHFVVNTCVSLEQAVRRLTDAGTSG